MTRTAFFSTVLILSITGCHALTARIASYGIFSDRAYLLTVCRDLIDFLLGVPLIGCAFSASVPESGHRVGIGVQYRLAFLFAAAAALWAGVLHSTLIFCTAVGQNSASLGAIGTIAAAAAILCAFAVYSALLYAECVRALFCVFYLLRGEKALLGAWRSARYAARQNRRSVRTLGADIAFVMLLCLPFLEIGLLIGIPFCICRAGDCFLKFSDTVPHGTVSVSNDPIKKE